MSPSFVGRPKLPSFMGMDEKDSYAVAAPVVDSGIGMCYAGIAGCGTPRVMLPSDEVQDARHHGRAPTVAYAGSFCWFRLALCSLWLQTGPNARHLGRYGPEEHRFAGDNASRAVFSSIVVRPVVDMLLVCNDRCRVVRSAEN